MISAFVGHLVGDYLIQNHWMASNKKHSTLICAIHCILWATSVYLFAWWPLWTWPILFITHFIQDRSNIIIWYMRTIGQTEFIKNYSPWSVIVVDNVWHIVTLWVIWKMI